MTLRNYIGLTFFALLTLNTTYGQGKEDKSYTLFKIKKVYQQINEYKNYKTVTIENSEDFLGHTTDNGGSLTGYYKGDSLKKSLSGLDFLTRLFKMNIILTMTNLFLFSLLKVIIGLMTVHKVLITQN